jgi:hypothetical protein
MHEWNKYADKNHVQEICVEGVQFGVVVVVRDFFRVLFDKREHFKPL